MVAKLGEGAFGVVHRARDSQLQRDVAIKVPHHRGIQSPEGVEAYLTEARILAGLRHPGIVPVYDAGQGEGGLPYVVSEFVEGTDLSARLAQGRLTPPQAVELVQLHTFGGLSVEDAGTHLGLSRAAAYRLWAFARAWLRSEMAEFDEKV